MISTADPYEANWSQNQKQLNSTRVKNARATSIPRRTDSKDGVLNSKKTLDKLLQETERNAQLVPKKSYGILKKNERKAPVTRTPVTKPSYNSTPRSNNFNSNSTNNQHVRTGTVRTNATPLIPPTHLRNNTSSRNDPYCIEPLPNIRSPYLSGRDQMNVPHLDSWGVTDQNYTNYDDYSYSTFNRGDISSPFLPTYNLARKGQKGYIIAPKFRRPIFRDVEEDLENNRHDYIAPIPYSKFENPVLSTQLENFELRTNQNIENVQNVLKVMDSKNYDGKELFSTKFLEDLDYQYQGPPQRKPQQPQRSRPIIRDPEADAYIQNLKNQVDKETLMQSNPVDKSVYTGISYDIAEQIYNEELERNVRKVIGEIVNQEMKDRNFINEPVLRIFESIYDIAANDILADIAAEILEQESQKAKMINNNAIKSVAKEELVSNLMLDHMLDKMAQHGRANAENSDISKILDGMVIDVLLNTNKSVNKMKDKTLKNYPIKKFHMNSFMNVALDILVAELSTNLEEDMKDLEVHEQQD